MEVDGTRYDAQVVSYDPNRDISILDVPNLRAEPLLLAEGVADSGSDALMLGYPGGGDFVATPVRIREVVELNGPDIYRTTTVKREVYTIRGTVRQGASGGPLINLDGKALGVAFGAAVDDPDTGFVLTAREVAPQVAKVGSTVPVATGHCISWHRNCEEHSSPGASRRAEGLRGPTLALTGLRGAGGIGSGVISPRSSSCPAR